MILRYYHHFFIHKTAHAVYLVPLSFSVQSDDDHGGVGEEALAVKRQIFPFPRHIQHVPVCVCKAGEKKDAIKELD